MRRLTISTEEVAHESLIGNIVTKRYLGLGSTKENRTSATCDSASNATKSSCSSSDFLEHTRKVVFLISPSKAPRSCVS